MTTNPDPHTDEFSMAICAIRYCIGRQSYIVSDGARWAREYGKRSKWVRETIIRDLAYLVGRCGAFPDAQFQWLGMKQDEKLWRGVLTDLKAMDAGEAA